MEGRTQPNFDVLDNALTQFGLTYNETSWTDGVTPINQINLNNIESGISSLYAFLFSSFNGNITILNNVIQALADHLTSVGNPHEVTKTQVGLPVVDNLSVVSASRVSEEEIETLYDSVFGDEPTTVEYEELAVQDIQTS